MWPFKKKEKPIIENKKSNFLEDEDLTQNWCKEQLEYEREKYKRMSNALGGYGNSSQYAMEQEILERKIKSVLSNMNVNQQKEAETKANIKLVTGMIKAFKLDYGTGEEVLNLFKTGADDNEKMATTMLFAAMRDGLKQEIINEINKK